MELGSYQEHIVGHYQENILRGTGVQASSLHGKMLVFLIISCSISELFTRSTRKIRCVYYPLSQDSYSTLSSTNIQWTPQIFSGSVICISQWKGETTSVRRAVRWSDIVHTNTCFLLFFPSLVLTWFLSPSHPVL